MTRRISPPLVISGIALILAAGGIGVGAGRLITGADIKNGSITGADIKNGSIASDDIKAGAIQVSDLSQGALKGLDGKDGKDGKDGAQGPAGPAAASGSGGFAETFTQAGPVSVSDGARQAFAFDRAVAWTTPASSIDNVYVTAKVTAPAVCSAGDRRIGMRVTVDGANSQPWYENIFYVTPDATTSFGDVVTTVGPGSHAITGFELESASPGCTVVVTDILLGVSRTS